jgi:fatty-acyl-CoA synthase
MQGLMMNCQLTLAPLVERAGRLFPARQIASKLGDGGMHRYTYRDFHARVHRLAHALERLGIRRGDRVGTLCWNGYRHLELYWAVPCIGAVLHTLNLRLASDQLAYIINHAGDRVIFVDVSLKPLIDAIGDQIPCVERVVVIEEGTDGEYETLLAESPAGAYPWPQLDEREAAATCYTSGTTGNPKGVLYDHRSLYLHTMALASADSFAISHRDTLLQLVPMFHANGWGMPYAAVMNGAAIVFGGRQIQPKDVAELIQNERATLTAGVPTLWMTLSAFLEREKYDISSLRMVVSAGSALPRQFILDYWKKYRVRIVLAWGMTETTPIATFMTDRVECGELDERELFDVRARHGMPVPGVDLRIVDENGQEAPADGATMGELQVRGPWVTCGYYQEPSNHVDAPNAASFMDGWFRTGDVATIDSHGYIQIMDRTKDLVKSGGEWISSVDLENAIMGHPKVMEAAVIAVAHPKWQERPLALIAPLPQFRDSITKAEILDFLADKVAKWWLPDDVVFIDAVPKTSVGKFNKRALREKFKDYVLPATRTAGSGGQTNDVSG